MCEPWLNPECTEMILYAHKQGHKICIFTTLTGMTLSDIDLIESIPFGFFQVHLPGNFEVEKFRVNDSYFKVLDKISKSNINSSFHCHGKNLNLKVKSILENNEKTVEFRSLYQRSGNIKVNSRLSLARRRGTIGCRRDLRCNVLLPNGDVLLCSNDYGMKHVLGNIVSSSYDDLFNGEEFVKIRKGLQDESIDIICRDCDNFCYDKDLAAKILNFPYQIDKYVYYLKDLRNVHDLKIILQKGLKAFKEHLKLD
jgi:radical SAM protein with 4Fe4S-binding SPASM domain